MFYIMKIINKGIATENLSDSSNEHFVMTGEPYLVGKCVSFPHEEKKFIRYKESQGTENALIHVNEVFVTDIKFNNNLELTVHDYHLLCCSL